MSTMVRVPAERFTFKACVEGGCEEDAADAPEAGPYQGRCARHRRAVRERISQGQIRRRQLERQRAQAPVALNTSLTTKCRELAAQAQRFEATLARAKKARAEARSDYDRFRALLAEVSDELALTIQP